MDITQLFITVGSVVGIVIVALLAIVPTVMEIPAPERSAEKTVGAKIKKTPHPGGRPSGTLHLPV